MSTWTVPRMWEGGEVWILGGGPSMPRQFGVPEHVIQAVQKGSLPPSAYSPYMESIHNRHAIAINVAYLIGDWMDIVFFGDNRFFMPNIKGLADYPGVRVTCHPKFDGARYPWVKYLARDPKHRRGISTNPRTVCWNGNSGAAAISVAANAGATRIILLGFDMTLDDKSKQHWHTLYRVQYAKGRKPNMKPRDPKKSPFPKHLRGFPDIAKDAKRRGIEIINASPTSMIEEFKKVTVEELLGIELPVVDVELRVPMKKMDKRYAWLLSVILRRGYHIGAEVGCAEGNTTKRLLQGSKDLTLYAVDLWKFRPNVYGEESRKLYSEWDFTEIRNKFDKQTKPYEDRLRILQGISWKMADTVEDGSLDFVFIDANHEYESVLKDVQAWEPKVKPGGLISGHDYNHGNFPGVAKAVNEIFGNDVETGPDRVWYTWKQIKT